MLGSRLVALIESHSDELAKGVVEKLCNSTRTASFRGVAKEELGRAAHEIYSNLSDWLLTKTESDIELRYTTIGARRAEQDIPLQELVWAIIMSKEHLWAYLQREAVIEGPVAIFGELELLRLLDQFFDRAVYYAAVGYSEAREKQAA